MVGLTITPDFPGAAKVRRALCFLPRCTRIFRGALETASP